MSPGDLVLWLAEPDLVMVGTIESVDGDNATVLPDDGTASIDLPLEQLRPVTPEAAYGAAGGPEEATPAEAPDATAAAAQRLAQMGFPVRPVRSTRGRFVSSHPR